MTNSADPSVTRHPLAGLWKVASDYGDGWELAARFRSERAARQSLLPSEWVERRRALIDPTGRLIAEIAAAGYVRGDATGVYRAVLSQEGEVIGWLHAGESRLRFVEARFWLRGFHPSDPDPTPRRITVALSYGMAKAIQAELAFYEGWNLSAQVEWSGPCAHCARPILGDGVHGDDGPYEGSQHIECGPGAVRSWEEYDARVADGTLPSSDTLRVFSSLDSPPHLGQGELVDSDLDDPDSRGASRRRDHYEAADAYLGGNDGPDVPMRCHDCGRPAYYDDSDDRYHHAIDADQGCFLIRAEDRPNDWNHPLLARQGARGGWRVVGYDRAPYASGFTEDVRFDDQAEARRHLLPAGDWRERSRALIDPTGSVSAIVHVDGRAWGDLHGVWTAIERHGRTVAWRVPRDIGWDDTSWSTEPARYEVEAFPPFEVERRFLSPPLDVDAALSLEAEIRRSGWSATLTLVPIDHCRDCGERIFGDDIDVEVVDMNKGGQPEPGGRAHVSHCGVTCRSWPEYDQRYGTRELVRFRAACQEAGMTPSVFDRPLPPPEPPGL